MLILLLLQIIRKLRSKGFNINLNKIIKQLLFKIKYVFPFLLLSMSGSTIKEITSERIAFEIVNKNNCVGYIVIDKECSNSTTTYTVNSTVETRFILRFKAEGRESSIYRNDTLIYSSVYRKLNNKVKVNQTVQYLEGAYADISDKNKSHLKINPITCSLVMLFFDEPSGINKVYCDKLKMNLRLRKLADGKYEVKFPNGGYNVFHYKNGRISHVDAIGTFFKVKLKKINKNNI